MTVNKKVLLATHNQGKVIQMQAILGNDFEIITASSLGITEPDETGSTFVENTLLKARHCSLYTDLPCIADDSGLCIEALGGAPGVFSARWAGREKNFTMAIENIRGLMEGNANKKAFFTCAIGLVTPDKKEYFFVGKIHGNLCFPSRGDKGFGYDPIFIANHDSRTFAEISPAEKNQISHRAIALEQLKVSGLI